MADLQQYRMLNESYRDKLVWALNGNFGFFSEFNGMLLGMLFALSRKKKFVLYSKSSRFAPGIGISALFQPFCPNFENRIVGRHISNEYFERPKANLSLFPYKLLTGNIIQNDVNWYCRSSWFSNLRFKVDELGIDDDIRGALRKLIETIYHFTPNIQEQIDRMISDCCLPESYASIHVRRGDKITERSYIPLTCYMEKLMKNCYLKNVFVSSDDYSVIQRLRDDYPEYSFYTLTPPTDEGYNQHIQKFQSRGSILDNLIELFASVEIMRQSQYWIGTYGSNIGLFLGILREPSKCLSLDFNEWTII